ncbi:Muramoyltetrapeptide carboxypeptidase LdcA (Peptidoglycan recycling) [Balamuthia mandrillaris]
MSKTAEQSRRASFVVPRALKAGDRVAIVAPSSGLASLFPWLRDQGVRRLRDEFQLEPWLLPTMSMPPEEVYASPRQRAEDLMRAFRDPEAKAIICSVGGDEMIRVLPFLDLSVLQANPKAVVGYSDITTLHLVLWNLGVVSYYGCNLLCQFALSGPKMHDFTVSSVRTALFEQPEAAAVPQSSVMLDGYLEWAEESNLSVAREMESAPGWTWHEWATASSSALPSSSLPRTQAKGRLFGGCLEVLLTHLAANKCIPPANKLDGAVLVVETSETMPPAELVYTFFVALGERGLLQQFSAVLMGRPKTFDRGRTPPGGRESYRHSQRKAVLRALEEYVVDTPLPVVVFDLDFGHTDPQLLLPLGAIACVDAEAKSIVFHFQEKEG